MDEHDDLPEELRRRLREGASPPPLDPAREAEIRGALSEAFEGQRPARRPSPWRWAWVPVAAAAAIVVWLRPRGLTGDVDGSGTLDVVDAWRVALHAREGGAGEEWDVDGDGLVTEGDARALLERIVRLEESAG